jgi:hypothetical protein
MRQVGTRHSYRQPDSKENTMILRNSNGEVVREMNVLTEAPIKK